MKLSELAGEKGSKKKRKRVGRGTSSGHGKTCGRGHKGQKSRSGGGKGSRFEGGQTPLYRRLPKFGGFKNYPFKKEYTVINVRDLNKFEGTVDRAKLIEAGLIDEYEVVKILGDGEISKALEIHADAFSSEAKRKIEEAGGKCIVRKKNA